MWCFRKTTLSAALLIMNAAGAAPSCSSVPNCGNNTASADYATVSGGQSNNALAQYSTIGGGGSNGVEGVYSLVGGGHGNIVAGSSSNYSSIVGGRNNTIRGAAAVDEELLKTNEAAFDGILDVILGQEWEEEEVSGNASFSVIGGGRNNIGWGNLTVIGGGAANQAHRVGSVGGGVRNTANGLVTTIGGGVNNTAGNRVSVVGGGALNSATGAAATVPGGYRNEAAGTQSVAMGVYAQALEARTAVLGFSGDDCLDQGNHTVHVCVKDHGFFVNKVNVMDQIQSLQTASAAHEEKVGNLDSELTQLTTKVAALEGNRRQLNKQSTSFVDNNHDHGQEDQARWNSNGLLKDDESMHERVLALESANAEITNALNLVSRKLEMLLGQHDEKHDGRAAQVMIHNGQNHNGSNLRPLNK